MAGNMTVNSEQPFPRSELDLQGVQRHEISNKPLNQIEEEANSENINFKDKQIEKIISELRSSIQDGQPISIES